MSITTDTRFESLTKVDRKTLYSHIINTLSIRGDMTAREVAIELYNQGILINSERQATAPRLTELVDKGLVQVVGKKYDEISSRNVAVYNINK